ncbi:MAG: DUF3365 domain-containing protein [Pirellulales bacterium]
MRKFVVPLVVLLGSTLTACAPKPSHHSPTSSEQAAVSVVEGQKPTEEQQQVMLKAKEALFSRLSGRLMEVLTKSGPESAIRICKEEAPKIAQEVSKQEGLSIGRTGVRLRNTHNRAPAWARTWIEQKIDAPQFGVLSNDKAAALLPIRLQPQCMICHGPKDQLAPGVIAKLHELYPNDEATGFEAGELRGWFWVELGKVSQP